MELWNTYDTIRDTLDKQYQPGKPFNPESGQTVAELTAYANAYLADHATLPRITQRAHLLAYLLTHAQLRVDPEDWFADHINTGRILWDIQGRWRHEAALHVPACQWAAQNAAWPTLDLSHTSPSWREILKYGFKGLRQRAQDALAHARDEEGRAFLQAVVTVYDAAIAYTRRLADEARRVNAARVIDTLDAIADNPPQTYQQALQLAYLFNQIQEIEGEYVRSQGVFDQLFYPFYKHDLDHGILTREQARELTCFIFDKFSSQHFGANKNCCFGGRTPDGRDLANELTDLCFECWAFRRQTDPKFSFRVHPGTPDSRLDFLAECIRNGQNAIVFANDDCAYKVFTQQGKAPEEVVDFLPIGCYEPAIMGRELSCTMSATANLAKIAEFVFDDDTEPADFDAVRQRAHALLRRILTDTMEIAKVWEQTWPQVNPSPFLSGSFACCLEKQRDVSHSGTKYSTSGIMCAGIGTLADALAAINYAVFQKHLVSWNELKNILHDNWQGHEKLRQTLLKKAPKYGCNNPEADNLLSEFANATARLINSTPNSKGNTFQCGLWSIDHFLTFGKTTGATPDGRFAQSPLSKNVDPTLGADTNGITGILLSAAKLPHSECPDGSILDVMLHPSALAGPDGHKVITNLIRTYFQKGGFFIHFNVVDAQVLRDAQAHPEQHPNLQVRVCGWNTRFVNLTHDLQNAFITEADSH